MIVDWLCDEFFTFLKSLFNGIPFDLYQLLQMLSNRIIISRSSKSCPFSRNGFQTLQTRINLHFSEMCAIYTIHGTVGPQLLDPSIIRTVQLTALLEYFDSKCMFY